MVWKKNLAQVWKSFKLYIIMSGCSKVYCNPHCLIIIKLNKIWPHKTKRGCWGVEFKRRKHVLTHGICARDLRYRLVVLLWLRPSRSEEWQAEMKMNFANPKGTVICQENHTTHSASPLNGVQMTTLTVETGLTPGQTLPYTSVHIPSTGLSKISMVAVWQC